MPTDLPTDAISLVGFIAMLAYLVVSNRQSRRVLGEVRGQVSNSHDTNMRDDIDGLIDAVDRINSKQDAHGTTLSKFMREMYASAARWDRIAAKYHPEES